MNKKVVLGSVFAIVSPVFFGILLGNVNPVSKIKFNNYNLKRLSIDDNVSENLTSVSSEQIDVLVRLDYDDFVFETNLSESDNQYKDLLLSQGKEYYSQKNKELMDLIDTSNLENLYISQYAPFFCFTVDSSLFNSTYSKDIKSLEKISYIKQININYTPKYTRNLNNVKYTQNISYINQNLGYTGKNIKVGILEPSILDKNHSNFAGKNVVVRDELFYFETVKSHTTQMGSIIGGKYGVAPDVSLYSVELFGNAISEFDWLLNQGVDIVNMSYGEETPSGYYNDDSAYVDYIVYTYKIICVAAAGNEGQGTAYVGNPGLSYNTLSVGACGIDDPRELIYSSYKTNSGPDKPNLTAPGDMFIPGVGVETSGTSNSSAFVSGCIALMLEANPSLKLHPEAVFAILNATTDTYDPVTKYVGLRETYGTGGINIRKAIENIDNVIYGTNTQTSFFREIVKNLASNSYLKVACWVLAYSDKQKDHTKFNDYDIFLLNSNKSSILCETYSTKNNCEYFEKKISEGGQYFINIALMDNPSSVNDNYAFAFYSYK